MFKKLKITDYIILLLIALILALGALIFIKKKSFSNLPIEKEANIKFEVFFRGVSITSPEIPFKVGDDAFITIRNVPYTKLKIAAIDGRPRMTYVPTSDGKGYKAVEDVALPALYDFIITLEDTAKKTPDGYVAGGNKIKMGIPVVIEGEIYKYQGTITNVIEIETEKK